MRQEGYVNVWESQNPSEIVIKIYNSFDAKLQKRFFDALHHKNYASYIIDLTEASYIDSTALGMLMVLYRMAHKEGGTIRIIGCCEAILRILHIANFNRFFEIEGIGDMASA